MPRRSSNSSYIAATTIKNPDNRNLPALPSQRPSFLQTMKEGVSFGIGNSLGHRLVGAVVGPSSVQIPNVDKKHEEYEQCIKDTNDTLGCEHLLRTK